MRELSTPSLFDVPVAVPPDAAPEAPAREEPRSDKLAKEFIRWCFSFGRDFRNSPDIINMRNWAQKTKLQLNDSEENELLVEARKLYLKRIEQMMKKSDTPALTL
jgi:hypothetical protein